MSASYLTYSVDKFTFRVQEGLLYSENDVWVRLENGVAKIGLTDYAQLVGGDLIFVDLPDLNKKVTTGDPVASYETIKVVFDILSPIDGYVSEVNDALLSKPELVNIDPYGDGWMVMLNPKDLDEESLLTPMEYYELMKSKVDKKLGG